MNIICYTDKKLFYERVLGLLGKDEAENNLPIGILHRAIRNGDETGDWFMARIENDSGVTELIALMTPPHNLIIASPDRPVHTDSLEALAEYLVQNGVDIPGVLGEKGLSIEFAERFSRRTCAAYRIKTDERLYSIDKVEDVALFGCLRKAEERDLYFLPYWLKGFYDDCFGGNSPLNADSAKNSIGQGAFYILECEGQPVSLAGSTRKMPNGRSVGPVYTPPYLRGLGYATSCVAQLSKMLLKEGNRYCVLFADLKNPVSNSIYQKIGYKPLMDFAEIEFLLSRAEDL